MDVHVRKAEVKDARPIASIHVRSWKIAYDGIYDEEKLAALNVDDRTLKWQQILGKDDTSQTYVAEIEKQVVGFATIGPSRHDKYPKAGELYVIHTDPEYYRRGVGKALLDHCKTRAKKSGFKTMIVVSEARNKMATSFYTKNGARQDGDITKKEIMGFDAQEAFYIWDKL